MLSSQGNSHFDVFGNPSGNNSFLDTLRSGLTEHSHNNLLYYGHGGSTNFSGFENGNGSTNNNNSVNVSHEDHHRSEIAMQFNNHNYNPDVMSNPSSGSSTPTVKQEMSENRILWGLPWQLNGERNYINGGNNEIDSLKESWNTAIVGSTWNNLLSPLM